MLSTFSIVFILNSLCIALVTALSIEIRFMIEDKFNRQDIIHGNFYDNFSYYLHSIPYYFSKRFNLLTSKNTAPEYIKVLYLFIITFIIYLFIFYLILFLLGYRVTYFYYLGNFKFKLK